MVRICEQLQGETDICNKEERKSKIGMEIGLSRRSSVKRSE